ncbi:MAG: multicopper oxidase family protein [Patescibacteria group bacterium]
MNKILGIALAVVVGVFVLYSALFNQSARNVPSTNISDLSLAKPATTIELKDGDTYDLTASYVKKNIGGQDQKMLAYNGSIPGPTIRVPQGAEVTINFKNNTDLPALLHSHGVRMDNAFDGSQLQQKEMNPGESFSYKLKFPDAGVYWYHPHAKEVYGQGLGLYGAFIVSPADSNYFPPVNREMPLFLSDLPIENGVIELDKDTPSHSLMGHYGNIMLVNGEEMPNIEAKAGEVLRLYIVNAANARPFNVAIKGLKLKLIGADSGAYEQASLVDSVMLMPSERAIIDVLIPLAGIYEIQHQTPKKIYPLGTLSVAEDRVEVSHGQAFTLLQKSQATIDSIDRLRSLFNKEPEKRIALTLDMAGGMMGAQGSHMMPNGQMMGGGMMGGSPDGIEWDDAGQMMNHMMDSAMVKWKIVDQDTGKANMDIDWAFKRGEPVKIRIFNDPKSMHPMQHPIHFHGQRFLVVARNGVQQTNLVWKDTTLVRSGETVDIILDPSNPGEWMAHCHISEHLESGMMFDFTVR